MMRSFESIYETAVMHKGSVEAVEGNLPDTKSERALKAMSNDRYLSEMSRRVFQAGLKHAMVNAKWPAFEEVFWEFDPQRIAMMSDEALEGLMNNDRIIRHFGKIKSVRGNASWMLEVIDEHGSFGDMIAAWPSTDIVGLWLLMKKRGVQLGGQSGARFLRMVGKDTFLLTDDVVAVLKVEGVVDKVPSSQRDLKSVQSAFNQWHEESGRPMAEISRIVSFTTNTQAARH